MKRGPEFFIFQIRIHSGKGAWHWCVSLVPRTPAQSPCPLRPWLYPRGSSARTPDSFPRAFRAVPTVLTHTDVTLYPPPRVSCKCPPDKFWSARPTSDPGRPIALLQQVPDLDAAV